MHGHTENEISLPNQQIDGWFETLATGLVVELLG